MAKNYADLIVEAKKIGIAFTGQKPDDLQTQIEVRLLAMSGQPTSIQAPDSDVIATLRQQIQTAIAMGAQDSDDDAILKIAQRSTLSAPMIEQVINEEFSKEIPQIHVANEESIAHIETPQIIEVPVVISDVQNEEVEGALLGLNAKEVVKPMGKEAKKPAKAKTETPKQAINSTKKTTKKDGPNENGQRILALWKEGKTKTEIAKVLGIYYSQVDSCVKRWADKV